MSHPNTTRDDAGRAAGRVPADLGEALLVHRQRRLLREGAVFIRQAAATLLPPGAEPLGDPLAGFLRSNAPVRQRAVLEGIADTVGAAANATTRDAENVSLCVFATAMLADALEAAGMALDEARLRRVMPGLDVGWCRARYRAHSLASAVPAGHA